MRNSSSALAVAAASLFESTYGKGAPPEIIYAPGRVTLIGDHIDYHDLPVLPMALGRGLCVAFRRRHDSCVAAITAAAPEKTAAFSLARPIDKGQRGDWINYVKAAALVGVEGFGITGGIDASVVSDLPVAAGLSSSSALLVAFALALLAANNLRPSLARLMEVLPEGEQFVGTRGGGMDQAAILASREGFASLINFDPFSVTSVPVPEDWRFVIADSMCSAEKSSDLSAQYNLRRRAGSDALRSLGYASYREALAADLPACLGRLSGRQEQNAFRHVVTEGNRVKLAVAAMAKADLYAFGRLLAESHQSLSQQLQVSTPAIDDLVRTALGAGAAGARITGAGFGGCVVMVCHRSKLDQVRDTLKLHYYSRLAPAIVEKYLFVASPAAGALESMNA